MNFTDKQLLTWANGQRRLARKSRLSKDREDKLNAINFQWDFTHIEENKAELLEMAKNGNPRPHKKKQSKGGQNLSDALRHYLKSDPAFAEQIKQIAPHWFPSKVSVKQQLIKMAEDKQICPPTGTNLRDALKKYTNPRSVCFDSDFNNQIRSIAGHWFNTLELLARRDGKRSSEENKAELLEMAKNGNPRPKSRRLLQFLHKHITDGVFIEQLKQLSPHWFIDRRGIAVAEKKQQLLKMAEDKQPRPGAKTQLGSALNGYTYENRNSYDEDFEKRIKQIAPQWFAARHGSNPDRVSYNKQQLLLMAKSGEDKPHWSYKKHPLSVFFRNYVLPYGDYYDPKFEKELRSLAPHWFVDAVAEKKKTLIEMAQNGGKRPNIKGSRELNGYSEKSLSISLSGYCSQTHQSYDEMFSKQVRELAPHWFRAIPRAKTKAGT